MADRRSLFSRFWPASASRRTPTTQTTTSPPKTESRPVNQSNGTSTVAETQTPARQSTTTAGSPTTPNPTTPPKTDRQIADQQTSTSPASREVQWASQSTTSASTIEKPRTSSPSRATTRSPPSSKPASSHRRVAQSISPPQPSSPSQATPQARRMGSQTSQSPSTPKGAPQPHSPSRLTSHSPKKGHSSSPKGTQPASPSKESGQPTQEMSSSNEAPILASNEKDPKLATSQKEPQMKAEVKSENSLDGTKLEETKDVKEVVQAIDAEANAETKKEVDESLAPKSGSEAQVMDKAEIPSEPEQMYREKQEALDTKKIFATSLTGVTPANTTASQPQKRSTISSTHNKSSLPNGEHVPLHKSIRDDMSTFVNQMAIGDPKLAIHDKPVNVITLAGENRGASMQMESNSSKREGLVPIHRSYKINPDESAEAITDGEGSSEGRSEDEKSTEDQPTEAYVNNNAQGINNSLVFNSSLTEGNPGVHIIVNHLPKEPIQPTDKTSGPVTRKAEVNQTPSEKLTYQPRVRRRCLRGLFLETSDDSDTENPEKPRRHGCRVGC